MNLKYKAPDYAAIENHIHAARVERAAYLAEVIVGGVEVVTRGLQKLAAAISRIVLAERPAAETDAFLKRTAPRY